jgi:hypothetical protein
VILAGGPIALYHFARDGLARGMSPGLAKGSIVNTFGGLKGNTAEEDMQQVIARFSGTSDNIDVYGMTEIAGGFSLCRTGRFHSPPWVVPYVLDQKTGSPLPREGIQRGRAAYFDLTAQSHWGGTVTSDIVDIDWSPCPCGRLTPHIGPTVVRDLPGDDRATGRPIGTAPQSAFAAALASLDG